MAVNITCLMTFFASTILGTDKWDLCEEDPHCLCGKSGLTDPLCAPPDVVETYCGLDNTQSLVRKIFFEIKSTILFFLKIKIVLILLNFNHLILL
jgi:hypothetical protein